MKIGIVSPYYFHRPGGVQLLVCGLADYLHAAGHEVVVIAPRPRKDQDLPDVPYQLELIGNSAEIKFGAPFHTTSPIAASSKKEIEALLGRHKFDIINVHEPWMPILPYQITMNADVPIVGTLHARWPRTAINRSLEKARAAYVRTVISRLDAITAGSSVSAANAYEADPDAVVSIIPNAIDLKAWERSLNAHEQSNRPYILFLNRLEKRKGPMLLLKAYKELKDMYPEDTPPLVMAGSGPLQAKLEEYASKHELDSVEFEGYVSDERKAELFAGASLYVSPAPYGESFGVVLVEAMASGTPVVAGNNEGYQFVLRDEGALSLVDTEDISAFAERLRVMLTNDEVRSAWLDWAKKSVTQYDFDIYAADHLAIFERVARG